MILVTVRMPEEFVLYVSRSAKSRNISESSVWREIAHEGIYRSNSYADAQRATLNYAIQTLCLTKRLVGHVNEDLIDQATSDAKSAIEYMEIKP